MYELIFLAALLCAPAVFTAPAVITSVPVQCVDPTFACQDLQSARRCGVVKSCINDIWSTMKAPEDNDDVCSICKEMVKEARDQLLSNMTQEEIKEVFEGSCKLLPVKLISDACIKVVDEFIPQLVEMLASRMDPNMVCTVSGLCNVAYIPKHVSGVKDELVCQFCTNVLEHIKELATANTTVEEFRTALHNFCNHTGSFSGKCSELVDDYFDSIFNFIRTMDTHGFCTLIGLCDNQKLNQYSPLVKIVPPIDMRKKTPAMKIEPAISPPKGKFSLPLVKIHPADLMKKFKPNNLESNDIDIESNDIFGPSKQLPLDRLMHPSVNFERDLDCSFCKAISFYLQKDLNGDRNKLSVDKALNNVCLKWVHEFPDQCKAVIAKYSIDLKHRIVEGASFDDLCFFAKACPLDENNGLNVRVVSKTNDNPICDLCKEAFTEVENQLKDPATKKSLENLLVQTCNYLPQELHDGCITFIDNNLDNFLSVLEQELMPDNVCPILGLCSQSGQQIMKANSNDIECDLCKDFVQQLQQKLQDDDVKKSVVNFLKKGCSLLPSEIASECNTFVDQNIDNLINVLVQDLDPNLVCEALNLCQNTVKITENDLECELCKEVIEKLDEQLKDQRTEEAIKEALEKVCSYLPSSMAAKCEHFVRQYSTMIISLLAAEMDPKLICTELNLCSNTQKKLIKVKSIECDICKEIISEVDKELQDNRTEEAIIAALNQVCSILPQEMADKCRAIVQEYTPVLIAVIASEMTPDMACAAINLCPEKAADLQAWKTKAQDLECEGCQYLLHYIQNLFMDATSAEKIKTALKRVCKLFPNAYDKNCEAYIDEYGSALLAIIAQELDPSQVCVDIQVCSTNCTVFKKQSAFVQIKPLSVDKCTLCTTVIDYISKLLEEDDIDKDITALVEKVCTVVPETMKTECSTVIEAYGPYILQMIGQLANSQQICQEIDMCPRTRGHVHLLGGKKCTFGPSYWCQSKVHAAACKAEMYCQNKVWEN